MDSRYYMIWSQTCEYPPVESFGDIFRVEVEFGGVELNEIMNVVILKLDFRNRVWKQIKTCKDRVIFMDHRKAYCFPTNSDKLRNKVFFTYLYTNLLCIYDTGDQSISIAAPFHKVPSPWETPIWVLPGSGNPEQLDGLDNQAEKENSLLQERPCDPHDSSKKKDVFRLEDLPSGVIHEIFMHLDPFDYMNFRSASTRLRNVAPPKISVDKMVNRTCLIRPFNIMDKNKSNLALSEEEMTGTTYANFSMVVPRHNGDLTFYITTPGIIKNARVLYSRHGWLLMTARFQSAFGMFLYKPLTKEVIFLPELSQVERSNSGFFLSSPDLPECLVVLVSYTTPRRAQIRPRTMNEWEYIHVLDLTEPGAARWEYHQPMETSHSYPVLIDNIFYFLGHRGNLFALKMGEIGVVDTFCALKVRVPGSGSYNQNFLVCCDGELLAVLIGTGGKWIKVFKLNRSGEIRAWNEVANLGDNCLYLSNVSTFAVKSDVPEMKSRIYFTWFYGESVVYYSMKTCKLHYTRMKDGSIVEGSLNDFSQCKEHCLSLWFEPC